MLNETTTEAELFALPCPNCGRDPDLSYPCGGLACLSCRRCYDGGDRNPQHGMGNNWREATEAWNALVEELQADAAFDPDRDPEGADAEWDDPCRGGRDYDDRSAA